MTDTGYQMLSREEALRKRWLKTVFVVKGGLSQGQFNGILQLSPLHPHPHPHLRPYLHLALLFPHHHPFHSGQMGSVTHSCAREVAVQTQSLRVQLRKQLLIVRGHSSSLVQERLQDNKGGQTD